MREIVRSRALVEALVDVLNNPFLKASLAAKSKGPRMAAAATRLDFDDLGRVLTKGLESLRGRNTECEARSEAWMRAEACAGSESQPTGAELPMPPIAPVLLELAVLLDRRPGPDA